MSENLIKLFKLNLKNLNTPKTLIRVSWGAFQSDMLESELL